MKPFVMAVCALGVLSMAACGGSGSKPNTSNAPTPPGNLTAQQVAAAKRGNVKCPASATTQQAAGAPVDDVTGIRPGMSWDEAVNFALCDNPLMVVTENTSRGFNLNLYGQKLRQGFDATYAKPQVQETGQQVVQDMQREALQRGSNTYIAPLQPGQARYFVTTMGLPNQEKVVSVAREEYFTTGKLPTVDSVQQALIMKYGPPTGASGTYAWWTYDPSGMKTTNGSCRINVGPDSGTSLSSMCGVTIGANIQPDGTNPGLAHSLAVTSQDGAAGMALISQTQQALQNYDAQQKANQLNNANKNGEKPTL